MLRKSTKTNYNPDVKRIYETAKKIDESISYDTVKEIIENCISQDPKNTFYSAEDHPAVREARKVLEKKRFEDDLKMIREEYPEETATSVWEFDEPFLSLVMTGLVDALTAYEAYIAAKRRKLRTAPPAIGGVGSYGSENKEYYTPEEVDRLTDRDYENPEIMRAVRRSMVLWNK